MIINSIGIALVFLIIWWFWLYRPKAAEIIVSDHVTITVDKGVYTPDVIRAPIGKKLTLEFLLKDESHCARTVLFDDFDISRELNLNAKESVSITPDKLGEFEFKCPMGMYQGKLIVEKAEALQTSTIDVLIDGGVYKPDMIRVPVGTEITLRFIRKDESHCAQTVIFEDLGISEDIPIDKPKEIHTTLEKPGVFAFACPMGMYQGKLIVE